MCSAFVSLCLINRIKDSHICTHRSTFLYGPAAIYPFISWSPTIGNTQRRSTPFVAPNPSEAFISLTVGHSKHNLSEPQGLTGSHVTGRPSIVKRTVLALFFLCRLFNPYSSRGSISPGLQSSNGGLLNMHECVRSKGCECLQRFKWLLWKLYYWSQVQR